MRHASRSLARRSPHFLLAALSAAVLSACGGGGGDAAPAGTGGGTGGTGGGGDTPAALTVSGVAAKGAALAGASVQASCATGSGSATALADGSYSLAITGGVLPCVLKATSSDGTTSFYSLAAGTGTTATANITPLTELVIAQMTGQEPAAFYASAAAGTTPIATAVTAEKIDAASTAVIQTLQAAGVDTSAITDIVSGSLVADTGTGNGNAYDHVLDTLGTTLTGSGTTLSDLVTTVATTSAASSGSGDTTTAPSGESVSKSLLPAALLLKPKAATCDALRNGSYRFIVVKPSAATGPADPVTTMGNATMDVAAANGPTWDFGDGSATLAPVANENCHYTVSGTDGLVGEFVISPSGYAVGRLSNTWTGGEAVPDPAYRTVLAMPTQSMTLADLAGKWNGLGWAAQAGGNVVDPDIATIDANGGATVTCNVSPATSEANCTDTAQSTFTVNADGGFDLSYDDGGTLNKLRAFGFRAGNGQTVVTIIRADGGVHLLTPYRTLGGATLGDVHKAWNVATNNAFVASDALQYNRFEVTAVDGANFTRSVTALATNVSHAQTMTVNSARNGWLHRAAGTAPGSDGSTVTVREMYTLKLGIGISAYWLPASNQAGTNARFGLSVTQP